MQTVLLEELDARTIEWLRAAAHQDRIVVRENGATLLTFTVQPGLPTPKLGGSLAHRVLLPEYEAIMDQLVGGTDSTQIISEDRDREIA